MQIQFPTLATKNYRYANLVKFEGIFYNLNLTLLLETGSLTLEGLMD